MSFAAAFELHAGGGATRHRIGGDALAAAAAELAAEVAGRTVFLVTEATVWGLHGERLAALPAACRRLHRLVVPAGEAAKQVEVADSLWRAMSAAGGKRDSRVIAFGGGSVGDLAGFVAGTFLRGVDWLLLPTTLLAQVDASIGGKTAVDLPEAKNAVGLFHHPRLVVADTGVLATLPPEQVRSGLVEAVKVAALLDPELLARIERDRAALLAGDAAALAPVVATAARLKAGLVERDPDERGERGLLNFGHTLGHALEAEVGYGRLLHGDAVAHGIRFALRLSVLEGGDPAFARRLAALLDGLGVPPLPRLAAAPLLARLERDKKAREGGLTWVLAASAGEGRLACGLAPERVAGELAAFLNEPAGESL